MLEISRLPIKWLHGREEEMGLLETLPETVLLHVFSFLSAKDLLNISETCKTWHRIARDEFLWRDLVQRTWKIDASIAMGPGRTSWLCEYKRFFYHTPVFESEVLREHRDQVLHVSFSHNGKMFATSSKDGYIKVWNTTYPATIRFSADLKKFTWKYTQFSQFNESDTLLLVSGVHFGSHSTSGEIAVFSLNSDNFELQCRVLNKPYDIFGTWYNNSYLLSGNLHWIGHLASCSALWLNYAFQATDSENESVVMRLFKFHNVNASSIRTIMIANCGESEAHLASVIKADLEEMDKVKATEEKVEEYGPYHSNRKWQKMQFFEDKDNRVKILEVDDEDSNPNLNGTIEYKEEYRLAENSILEMDTLEEGASCSLGNVHQVGYFDCFENDLDIDSVMAPVDDLGHSSAVEDLGHSSEVGAVSGCSSSSDRNLACASMSQSEGLMDGVAESSLVDTTDRVKLTASRTIPATTDSPSLSSRRRLSSESGDKYLIFTTGSKTYTPHQIGIKRIKSLEAARTANLQYSEQGVRLLPNVDENFQGLNREDFDTVDHLIELDGHIIGMCLSPDHRYLYVNSRTWPKGYEIEDPLYPPPIAQEIDIHVIDLLSMKEVGTMHQAHKAYTPNDECFFIFLDVCDEYVASGAEDKHGYLWDRHYGIPLQKFPHDDVVNSVAFNPCDPETLVTVSDDFTIKIWRSRNREKELK